ncbi:sensor histidine kinase [Actinoplanes bogorensis]|uniref:histidine kinase n=1 Tax=Paractinoplanes bogorensis TaxID=1610840 RepID=A0ABS5YXA4_9ACTN|nr:histidine kinase [Actinoplanes bogorensis]MBU2668065.1 sensor histidine kinase [Actinoplanes bogorensis]
MSGFAPRKLAADSALALVLLAVTLAPALIMAVTTPLKQGDRAGLPVGSAWWLFTAIVVAGLLIRQHRPVAALALIAAGSFGHLALQTKFSLLDLALPLALFSLAAAARRRRTAFAVLALVMVLTYLAMLAGRIGVQESEKAAAKQAAVAGTATKVIPAGVLADTGQAVLEIWLLSVAAFAVGDGLRSRRAHLAAVEQRTADLAREERQRAALAVAAERNRITRELHDVVAHGMSVMVVQAQGAAAALDRHPERAAGALHHVIEVGRSSLAEMRRLLAAERTGPAGAPLAPLPGVGAVPALVDDLRRTGMPIDLSIEGTPTAVPAAVDLSAYRTVQEALTNTLKHAGPGARARVRLEFQPDRVRVEVSDDGAGPTGGGGGGNGLRGIAERVSTLGGTLESGPGADGRGYRLAATLPLAALVTS